MGCFQEHDDRGTYTFDTKNNRVYLHFHRDYMEDNYQSTDILANIRLTPETLYFDFMEDKENNNYVDDWNVGYKK